MMTQQVEKKKKKIIAPLFDAANMLTEQEKTVFNIDQKYVGLIDNVDRKKKDLIREYADALRDEGQMPIDTISKHLCDKLEGLANKTYIIDCLPDEYKNQDKADNRRGRSGTRTETKCPHCGLGADEQSEVWQIKPSAYRIEDLDHYDRVCMKSIIQYLHNELRKKQ